MALGQKHQSRNRCGDLTQPTGGNKFARPPTKKRKKTIAVGAKSPHSPRHSFPKSPHPFVTTSVRHHLPSSPLPKVTISLGHHYPSSPPCRQVLQFYLSVTRKYCFPTSLEVDIFFSSKCCASWKKNIVGNCATALFAQACSTCLHCDNYIWIIFHWDLWVSITICFAFFETMFYFVYKNTMLQIFP